MALEMLLGIALAAFVVLFLAIFDIFKYRIYRRSEESGSASVQNCHTLCASEPNKGPSVSCETLCFTGYGGA
jgi:hypothetical protein